jgi:hypothetical protein
VEGSVGAHKLAGLSWYCVVSGVNVHVLGLSVRYLPMPCILLSLCPELDSKYQQKNASPDLEGIRRTEVSSRKRFVGLCKDLLSPRFGSVWTSQVYRSRYVCVGLIETLKLSLAGSMESSSLCRHHVVWCAWVANRPKSRVLAPHGQPRCSPGRRGWDVGIVGGDSPTLCSQNG